VANDQNQLDIQNQINAALTARSALFKKQAGMLEGQVMLARELCSALKCEDLEGMDDRLGEIRSSMEKAANEAERLPSTFDESSKSVKDVEGNLVGTTAATGMLAKAVDSVKVGFLALKATGMALFDVFKAGFNIISAGYGLWNKFTSSIIAASSEAAQRGRVVAQAYEDLRDTFGDLSTGIGKEAVDAISQFDEAAAEAGVNAGRFFGPFAEGKAAQIKAIGEAISNLGALAIGPLAGQVAGASLEITMLQKGAGLSAEALQSLGNRALNAGQTLQGTMEDASRSIASVAKAMGVSTKTLGKNFDAIAKDVVTFGHLSVKEMTSLSAVMTKTGISMKTLQGVATGFDDFEKGADSVAKLSQAFGMQLNSVDMLNASDDERIAMLKESFMATGKSIDQLSRQERAYLATAAGVDANDLESVFGDQAASIEETKTQAELAQEAQISSAEAMQEMAKSIRTVFKDIKNFTSFFGSFMDGFQEGFLMSSEGLKDVYAALDKVFDIGLDLGKWVAKFVDDMGGFDAIFDLDGTVAMFQLLSDSIKGLLSGTLSLEDVFMNFFNLLKPKLEAALSNIGTVFESIFTFLTSPPVIQAMKDGISKLASKMGEVLSNPKVWIPLTAVLGGVGALLIGKAIFTALAGAIGGGIMGKITSMLGGGGGDAAGVPKQAGIFQGMVEAFKDISYDDIVKAGIILGGLAIMTAGGVLLFALALEKAGSMVTPGNLLKGSIVMGVMVGALMGVAAVAGVAALIATALSGPQAALALAGLVVMGLLLPALALMGIGLVNLIAMVPMKVAMKALKIFPVIAMVMAGLAAMTVAAAVIGAGMVLGGAIAVAVGLKAIKGVADAIMEYMPEILGKIIEVTAGQDPQELSMKVRAVANLINALTGFAAVFAQIAEVGSIAANGTDASNMFESLNTMFTGLLTNIKETIETILAKTKDFTPEQLQKVGAVAGLIDSMAGLMGGLAGPMESLKTTSTGWLGGTSEEIDPVAIATFGAVMANIIDTFKCALPPLLKKIAGMDIGDPEALKIKTEAISSVVKSMSDLAAIDPGAMDMLGWNTWAMLDGLYEADSAFRWYGDSARGGPLAVATALVEDYNQVMDEMRKLGEGGISLSAVIDKIEKGITTKGTKIRLDSQKVQLNITVQVKLEADKLAAALADKTIVDPKLVLAQAGGAV